jgi:hypothetical protein
MAAFDPDYWIDDIRELLPISLPDRNGNAETAPRGTGT